MEHPRIYAGVDTHSDTHTLALIDEHGRPLATQCISSNWCEQCRHLFWTLSAFRLDGMGGWLVSFVCWLFHE